MFVVKSPHVSDEARPSILSEFIRETSGKSHELIGAVVALIRDCSGIPLIVFDTHVCIDCILTAGSRVPPGTM